MTVLAIHRATQQVLHRLPSELTPMIRGWIGGTRLDWRTCKQSEAQIIKDYNEDISRFVQELMSRRRERSERRELSLTPLNHHINYHIFRIWMYWYGLYQFMVIVCEWVNTRIN
jgi:hypothetical protein